MKPKLISVIIPTLQEEKLVDKILSQFTDEIKEKYKIELIISDGGSSDKTLEIAKRYADFVIEKEGNYKQNISIGRNIGAKSATSDILLFINADTLINKIDEFFSAIFQNIDKTDCVGVTCPVYVHTEEENFADRFFHKMLNYYFFSLNFLGLGMGRGECQVVKKELFLKVGGYNERIAAGEDFDLFKRLRQHGKIYFLWNISVSESPRRYRKQGYFRVIISWLFNAVAVVILRRSILDEWKPIR